MTIARELVTKLSFSFDRTNLDKFERSIIGFKTKFALATTAIGAIVKKTIDFFKGIADGAIATKDLADYAGIAVSEFVALRNVAEKFSIDPESFNVAFSKLSIGIKEASRGAGDFFEIVKQTQGKINFRGLNGQLLTARDVLLQIFDYINSINDRGVKLRILGNIFDPAQAGAWLRIIEQGRGEFEKLVDSERVFGEKFQQNTENALLFQREISNLNVEFRKLYESIAFISFPTFQKAIGGINILLDKAQKNGLLDAFNFAAEAIADSVQTALGFDTLSNVQKQVQQEDVDFNRRLQQQQTQHILNSSSPVVTNNNSFVFEVPPGTTEHQASFMSDQVKIAMENMWLEKTREVINNNPQVE